MSENASLARCLRAQATYRPPDEGTLIGAWGGDQRREGVPIEPVLPAPDAKFGIDAPNLVIDTGTRRLPILSLRAD